MLLPGAAVGPWHLLARLDSGAFGVVYRAQRVGHPDSPAVALKVARRPGDCRFEREAELLRLGLPGAPRFEDEGMWTAPDGQRYPFVVMELVEGPTLYDWFRARQRTSRDVLKVLAQVAGALAGAHARGAVHRDVKGDNIRVTAEGRAVLLDWGSGWFAGARPLTDTTAPPGTTVYRPPEQRHFTWRFRMDAEARWKSQPTDDLYSLGVALYRMVTGTYLPPLSEGGEVAATREVRRPSDYATLSMDLEALILRLLSNEREQRGTAEALAREAAALATAAGDAAGMPIGPTASAESTDKGFSFSDGSEGSEDEEALSGTDNAPSSESSSSEEEEWRPSNELRTWLSWASAAMVGGLLVLIGSQMIRTISEQEPAPPWIATAEEVVQFAPDAGVGEDALSSAQEPPRAAVSVYGLSLPLPKTPMPGQRRPPCDPDSEVAALGACWTILVKKPPCGSSGYELDDLCVIESFRDRRQPTSDEP
jgi:serine/threonine protein kinase